MEIATDNARISLRNDYSEGAHPRLLQALAVASAEVNRGYGLDVHSARAAALIRDRLGRDADVHFLAGGTQTNLVALAAFLRPHEAVIAPASGHIATHETGAIEASGHKVLTVATPDGKLSPALIRPCVDGHHGEHMVKPRLVYISNSTEWGTVYSADELQALGGFCRDRGLLLYLDGARLASALTTEGNDLDLALLAGQADAFYIGGTKNGALLGEALVIVNPVLRTEFRHIIKQRGAMLAKGMVIGAQFEALFEDGLYFVLATHANAMAARLRGILQRAGVPLAVDSPSNQVFPVLPDAVVERLQAFVEFETWERRGDGTMVIRLMTSWATPESDIEAFTAVLTHVLAEGQDR
ncbi:beta-eliminating lyase-related protein [Pseudoxanthomonas sp. F37]|jgi:threonine aldolase|uniref:threonine aldolase family protein n=1 Tax=Pseudoxanthomonas TaxID=83618 RepID=UPI001FCFB17C|nr:MULTISPECIES: beta-eliminating lyase-related protein [Pseudoxanthomonas]UOV06626.1 beta-eliminating lyase-related protein [Pseudoxanthomonas mexicana]UOV08235.1 beta-eliminating lyase-related protein [Pseudoxanthomonas sp. F37]